MRAFINDTDFHRGLIREAAQRDKVLDIWIKQGMTANDVGVLSDADEVFSRDFLRAVQVCEVPALDYSAHRCNRHMRIKIMGAAQAHESSPECVTTKRMWGHPEMLIGACLEGIGDETQQHVLAPRRLPHGYFRETTWESYSRRFSCGG